MQQINLIINLGRLSSSQKFNQMKHTIKLTSKELGIIYDLVANENAKLNNENYSGINIEKHANIAAPILEELADYLYDIIDPDPEATNWMDQ